MSMTDGNTYKEEGPRLETPEGVIEFMGGSATSEEWGINCDVVVASFGGGVSRVLVQSNYRDWLIRIIRGI